jgi:drug/metabolite transporter (DMT)-like permease
MLTGPLARRDIAALALAATCWGLGTVISKATLHEIPPVTTLAIQLVASVVILSLVMRRQGTPLRGDGPALLGRLGLLNPGIAYALSLVGLATITASVSVLLWALEPLLILVLAAIFLGERLTPGLVLLSFVAVGGLVLVAYDPAGGESHLVGVLLTVAGVACCAAYTVITRRFIPNARDTSQVVLSQQVHALGLVAVATVLLGLVGVPVIPTAITPTGLLGAIASGALYYAAAYSFYLYALRRVPASIAAASFYLIPVVGVAAGAVLLGERLNPSQWIGAIVVLTALTLLVARSRSSSAAGVLAAAGPS